MSKSVTRKELRQFGLIMATGIILIFGLLFPWIGDRPSPIWPLQWPPEWPRNWPVIIASSLCLTGFILPILLKPLYWVWMKIGAVLGWINTRIILSVIFYLVIFPAGLVMRLFNDPMARRFDKNASSYRIPSEKNDPDRLEKPF